MGNLSEHEKLIKQYLQGNNKDAAVQLIFKLIVKNAREKKFMQAEALRDRLFEVDSMALNEIVKSGEVIEEEKSNAIDKNHLNIWSNLYENLTREETNTLFYGMRTQKFPAHHMIFKQGEICSRLYFVDEGQLKMFYRQEEKAILLKILGPGDIAGEDTFFFQDAFFTTSLITASQVKLHVLEKDDLQKLNEKAPGLESKIHDLCLKRESVFDLLKAKKLERRVQKRLTLPGKALVQILNDNGQPVGRPFRGSLLDISASGAAIIIKTTQKSARVLLGRKLNLKFSFAELASDLEIKRFGTVVAVNSEPFNEYISHVEFGNKLRQSVIDELEALTNPDGA